VSDGPEEDRARLVAANLRLVWLLAWRVARRFRGVEVEELVSEGTIGLIGAVERFDPDRGVGLSTYATHSVLGAMLDFLRREGTLPERRGADARRADREERELAFRLGRQPEAEELAEALGWSVAELDHARERALIGTRRDLDDDALAPVDLEREFLESEQRERIKAALDKLDARTAHVIRLYFWSGRTLSEIGRELQVTDSRVLQILRLACGRLEVLLRRRAS
jgi:RNA polymerase sigma factor (sigma-70 family)